jgi:hypothetical protein
MVDVLEKLALYETLEHELQSFEQANTLLKKFALQ